MENLKIEIEIYGHETKTSSIPGYRVKLARENEGKEEIKEFSYLGCNSRNDALYRALNRVYSEVSKDE